MERREPLTATSQSSHSPGAQTLGKVRDNQWSHSSSSAPASHDRSTWPSTHRFSHISLPPLTFLFVPMTKSQIGPSIIPLWTSYTITIELARWLLKDWEKEINMSMERQIVFQRISSRESTVTESKTSPQIS